MAHPTLAGVPDERLRPALDAAFAVAVDGRRQRPPVAPPEALRPYLRFQKLPRTALVVVRTALDDDPEFRDRVAHAVDPAAIGPEMHAWLARPDGWEATVRAALSVETEPHDAVSVRRQAKRRAAAESAAARTAAELGELRDALERERAARADAAAVADELRHVVAAQRVEIDGLQKRARRAEADIAAHEHDLSAAREAAAVASAAGQEAAAIRDRALADRARIESALAAAGILIVGDTVVADPEAPNPRAAASSDAARPAARAEEPAGAVREAAASLRSAAAALDAAAQVIAIPPRGPAAPVPPRHRRSNARPPRRRPLAMPGGVSASSVDGALHLLRVPGLELVVDGYNVAKRAWPALGLAEQRECCIDAVEDIVRRYGTRALVVFDGSDVAVAVSARRLARVQFSPPDVIADDVIREVVGALPAEQAVAVATNDREVVASVRAMGANTIASETLLAAAGRSLR